MTLAEETSFAAAIKRRLAGQRPLLFEDLPCPAGLRVLMLAPHPDDFEAVAVTLRFLRDRGSGIRVAVISSSASGVEDSFCSPPTPAAKARIREAEQQAGCRLFGLADHALVFLRLSEDQAGHPLDNDENFTRLTAHLQDARPDIVLMPHGNDTNPGHRRAFEMLRRFAEQTGYPPTAFLNRDPKTIRMRSDLYTCFGEHEARWKAALLRCHRSQQQRNINTRGYGLDERILRVNREAAAETPAKGPYSEVFEIWMPDFRR